MRFFIFSLAIAAACLFAAGQVLAAEEKAAEAKTADAGKETAQPDVPKEELAIKGSKKTVMFSHVKGHEKIECVVCHHKVNDVQTYAKCSNEGCHDNLKDRKGENSLYFVMHSKAEGLKHQTCMECHARTVAEKPDLKKQMTGCSGSWCHPGGDKKAES